ncbi:TPA: TolC family protein [Morganella morganii]|uniref:TolC family protein n=1 Tax=Morganella morganii TaxID=582 RepID=UPI001BDA0DCF|nr:TolC family protein [Morganella morganii]MBT0381947.1 TolC family protein [Morganella morganii subsp. morganii]HDU8610691.1 TolC family protein [Morganella morganii]
MHSAKCLFAALLCLFSAGVQAVTLSELGQSALNNDLSFRAAGKAYEAEQAEAAAGKSHLLPSAGLSYQNTPYNRLTQRAPVTSQRHYSSHSLNLVVTQPLFDYTAYHQYRAAQIRGTAAESRLQIQQAELINRLVSAYLNLACALELQKTDRLRLALNTAQLAAAQRLLQLGEGTVTEVESARARLWQRQAQIAETEAESLNALLILSDLTGLAQLRMQDLPALKAGDFRLPYLNDGDYAAQEQQMLAVHPEIKAAQQETALAKAASEVQRGAFMPSAQLFAVWSDTQSDSNDTVGQRYRNLSAGIHLSVPLFSGGKDLAGMRKVSAQIQQAQYEQDALVQTLRRDLARQYQAFRRSSIQLAALEQAAAAARLQVTAAEKGYAAGQNSQPEVAHARDQYYQAEQELTKARYDGLLAWFRLRHYSSTPETGLFRQIEDYFTVTERLSHCRQGSAC